MTPAERDAVLTRLRESAEAAQQGQFARPGHPAVAMILADDLLLALNRIGEVEREVERDVTAVQNSGNGLYLAIHDILKPYFPADTRDLEWDVLPGAISKIVREARGDKADKPLVKCDDCGWSSRDPANPREHEMDCPRANAKTAPPQEIG